MASNRPPAPKIKGQPVNNAMPAGFAPYQGASGQPGNPRSKPGQRGKRPAVPRVKAATFGRPRSSFQ